MAHVGFGREARGPMDVLTGSRMRKVDEETIARYCPGLELMERAGRHVADVILERFDAEGFRAAVFVGPGNNGGDALVVARRLVEAGRSCSVHYLTSPDKFSVDAAKNYQRLQSLIDDPNLREANSTRPDWLNIAQKDLIGATMIVDGLFGTGLSRRLEGRAAELVDLINARGLPVVSIDIPSGLHSDTGEVLGRAVRATLTVTMGYPKVGMLFHPGRAHVGALEVADLGFPEEVLQVHSLGVYLLDRVEAAARLPVRRPDVHKYTAGTVLLVAGSRAFTGAVMLAAEGALRSGCGMVYTVVPEGIRAVIQTRLPEAVVVGVPESTEGGFVPASMSALGPYLDRADVVAAGPGVGRDPSTAAFIRDLVNVDKPLVLDADGIGAFDGDWQPLADRTAATVLTPHSGELARLVAKDIDTTPLERIEQTRGIAAEMGLTLVHKGAPTIIAAANGEVWLPSEADSSLATAGSGDVLTGIIAGVAAQGASALDAAQVATFAHARSGALAAGRVGVRSVIASDLLGQLGPAMVELEPRNARVDRK